MECATASECMLKSLDEVRKEQQKHGCEITCLCAESERLQFENKHLRFHVVRLEDRLDRLEEDARGNNLLFYGIPRSGSHESAGDCEQKVLVVVHRVMGFQREVPIEEARRVGSAIIARFLHRRDRNAVLANLQRLKGSKFSVREDVSPTVRQKQRGLLPVYKELRGAGRRARIRGDKLVTDEGIFTYDLDAKRVLKVGMAGSTRLTPVTVNLRRCITNFMVTDSGLPARNLASRFASQSDRHFDSVEADRRVGETPSKTADERASSGRHAKDTFSGGSSVSRVDGNSFDTHRIDSQDGSGTLLDVGNEMLTARIGRCDGSDSQHRNKITVSQPGEQDEVFSRRNNLPSTGGDSTSDVGIESTGSDSTRVMSPVSNSTNDEARVMSPLSNSDSDMTKVSSVSNAFSDATRVMSPLSYQGSDAALRTLSPRSIPDVTEGFAGEVSLDSGLSTFTGSLLLSQSFSLGNSHGLLATNQSDVDSVERTRPPSPSSRTVPAADPGRGTDNARSFVAAHPATDLALEAPCDFHSRDEGSMLICSSPREGAGSCREDRVSRTGPLEKGTRHGPGWFSYLHDSRLMNEKRRMSADGIGERARCIGNPRSRKLSSGSDQDGSVSGGPRMEREQSPCRKSGIPVLQSRTKENAPDISTGEQVSMHPKGESFPCGSIERTSPREMWYSQGQKAASAHRGPTAGMTPEGPVVGTVKNSPPEGEVIEIPQVKVHDYSNAGHFPDECAAGKTHENLKNSIANVSPRGEVTTKNLKEEKYQARLKGEVFDGHGGDGITDISDEGKFEQRSSEGTVTITPRISCIEHYGDRSYANSETDKVSRRPSKKWTLERLGDEDLNDVFRESKNPLSARGKSPRGKRLYPASEEEIFCDNLSPRNQRFHASSGGGRDHDSFSLREQRVCAASEGKICDSASEGRIQRYPEERMHDSFSPREQRFYASSEEGRVHDNSSPRDQRLHAPSREGKADGSYNKELVHGNLGKGNVHDSFGPREERYYTVSGERTTRDSSSEGRMQGNAVEGRIRESSRERRIPDSPRTESTLESPRTEISHGSSRNGSISSLSDRTPVTRSGEAQRVPSSARGHDSLRGRTDSRNKGMSIKDVFGQVCDIRGNKRNSRNASRSKSACEADRRNVGWHRSGGQWQYCHKRAMADVGQHPANQGALLLSDLTTGALEGEVPSPVSVNGLEATNGEGDAREQEQDHISQKLNEMQDSIILPIKEDLSEWITRIIGVEISPESFIEVLDSGVVLCTIAKLIEKHAQQCAQEGKLTEPLPNYKLKCNANAKSGTWFSRDNVTCFLGWCRAYGMTDETMFDSEDLVSHKQEKPVVNCVLELARLGWKYGIEPPNLIRMEREIETEAKEFEPPPFVPKPVEIVKEKPVEKPVEVKKPPEKLNLDKEVKRMAHKCKCQEYVNRISEGVYDVFGKRVFIRLLHGKHLMVRVGGGWDTFENYLRHHDPIQVYEFHRDERRPNKKDNFEGYLVIKSKYKSS